MPTFLAAFTGTSIEFFETTVIAYAVVRAGFAREAITAVVVGHLLILAAGIALLPLAGSLPIDPLRWVAAVLLTAMGLHWTQKSVRRLIAERRPRWAEDPLAAVGVQAASGAAGTFAVFVFLVMLKTSVVEGAEILLVAWPIGAATGEWPKVLAGVASGMTVVTIVALLLHRRLQAIPEVKFKLVAGVLLLMLGCAWLWDLGGSNALGG